MLTKVTRLLLVATSAALSVSACSDPATSLADLSLADQRPVDLAPRDAGPVDHAADLPVTDAPLPDAPAPDAPCPDPGVTVAPGVTLSPTNLSGGGLVTVTYGPPAALAAAAILTLHYGANYWGLDLGGGAQALDIPMTQQSDGTFAVDLTLPAQARLLDFVFFTETGSGKQWDNNNQADFHRGVGVPLHGPYLTLRDNLAGQPDRNPATSITVSFTSDRPCVGEVRYGTSAAQLSGKVVESSSGSHHHLNLKGLSPNTQYHYRVACTAPGAGCALPETSPIYSFRTAKPPGSTLTFVVLSDPQDNRAPNDRWAQVATALNTPAHGDVSFLVLTGDLVGDDLPPRWWDFFDKGRALLASRPLLPVVGNHDTPTYGSHGDSSSFEALFAMGGGTGPGTFYGVVYGPATLLVLNSESSQVASAEWHPGGAQYQWLLGALAGAKTPWRFAAWHIPPYNAGVRHVDQVAAVQPVTALLNDQVDWVFCGHEHLYQRFKPIRFVQLDSAGQVVSQPAPSYGPGGGVGYLVAPAAGHDPPENTLVAAGHPMRGLLAYPDAAAINNDTTALWVGFIKVKLTGKSIEIAAVDLDQATPRDQLSYSKP